MYQHCDTEDSCITLHACMAEKMTFEGGVLSFIFPDGFWITGRHPENRSGNIVRTSASQVDLEIIDREIEGITIYTFRKSRFGKVIRREWEPMDFIAAVNSGRFRVEFITQYKSFQSILYQCWVWYGKKPFHSECKVILHTEKTAYRWNALCYDRVW